MRVSTTLVSPVQRCCRAQAVRFQYTSKELSLNTVYFSIGFFTLIVGRIFRVESLSLAKICAVVARYFTSVIVQIYSYLSSY